MKSSPTIDIYLDTRKVKKDNTYPVKLRVTYERKSRYYNTTVSLTKEDYDKALKSDKPRGEFKELRHQLLKIEEKALNTVEAIPEFSFLNFETKYLGVEYKKGDIFDKYREYIETLEANDQLGTKSSYECSMNSLYGFLQEHSGLQEMSFPFSKVSPSLLEAYESYMLRKGKSISTVGVYLRPLRALFNLCRENGEISNETYPFGKKKYQIPASTNHKRALTNPELKKLLKTPADVYEEKARDFWFLSYLCNGMNMKDLLGVKYGINLQKDALVFFRGKTKRTNKTNQREIIVPLIDHAVTIINKYKTGDESKGKYVFSTLNDSMSSAEKRREVLNFTRFVNQHMKRLAGKAGIGKDISTMWARHSFANTMLNNDASVEFISESIGHANIKTTATYLSGFNMERKKNLANKLMDFIK